MHPRSTHRGPWLEYAKEKLPVLHDTLIRLKVERLPGDRDPKPVWLWCSATAVEPPTPSSASPGPSPRTSVAHGNGPQNPAASPPCESAAGFATSVRRQPARQARQNRPGQSPDGLAARKASNGPGTMTRQGRQTRRIDQGAPSPARLNAKLGVGADLQRSLGSWRRGESDVATTGMKG